MQELAQARAHRPRLNIWLFRSNVRMEPRGAWAPSIQHILNLQKLNFLFWGLCRLVTHPWILKRSLQDIAALMEVIEIIFCNFSLTFILIPGTSQVWTRPGGGWGLMLLGLNPGRLMTSSSTSGGGSWSQYLRPWSLFRVQLSAQKTRTLSLSIGTNVHIPQNPLLKYILHPSSYTSLWYPWFTPWFTPEMALLGFYQGSCLPERIVALKLCGGQVLFTLRYALWA